MGGCGDNGCIEPRSGTPHAGLLRVSFILSRWAATLERWAMGDSYRIAYDAQVPRWVCPCGGYGSLEAAVCPM